MKIGEHIGNYVTYRTNSGNHIYKGYVFEDCFSQLCLTYLIK